MTYAVVGTYQRMQKGHKKFQNNFSSLFATFTVFFENLKNPPKSPKSQKSQKIIFFQSPLYDFI